tara:strand:- start:64 stop:678 length:615 start_codon:yes stop_codon:yes gene_type:complete
MKISKARLKQIIKEELQREYKLNEGIMDSIKGMFGGKKGKKETPEAVAEELGTLTKTGMTDFNKVIYNNVLDPQKNQAAHRIAADLSPSHDYKNLIRAMFPVYQKNPDIDEGGLYNATLDNLEGKPFASTNEMLEKLLPMGYNDKRELDNKSRYALVNIMNNMLAWNNKQIKKVKLEGTKKILTVMGQFIERQKATQEKIIKGV